MKKKSKFQGKVNTYDGIVFGTLESGDTVIVANSIADAKSLVGSECEYEPIKDTDPVRFRVIGWQL